jgi:hypothetical protein
MFTVHEEYLKLFKFCQPGLCSDYHEELWGSNDIVHHQGTGETLELALIFMGLQMMQFVATASTTPAVNADALDHFLAIAALPRLGGPVQLHQTVFTSRGSFLRRLKAFG